ncbi:PxKF domain-containing protein [Agromyces tardus]|uniref:PxKF domain-containing protein n=1 Tax=Agromyces tardus TaxID=2583849 RepID=UPI00110C42F0|nr:PxKF domain-containing protein [Agromyces tardus]
MKRWGMSIAGAATAAALILGGGGIAYADSLFLTDELDVEVSSIDFGPIACGEQDTATVSLAAKRNGNVNSGNVFANSSTVTFSVLPTTGDAGAVATQPAPSTAALPGNWVASNNIFSTPSDSEITVGGSVEGTYTSKVTYKVAGTNTSSAAFSTTKDVTVSWEIVDCEVVVPDETVPVVVVTCPTEEVLRGSTAYATWVATDEVGGSGIAEPSSGSIELDTSSYGAATATAPVGTAKDIAGNESAEATCAYFVTEKTPPVVVLTCPDEDVLLGSSAEATWVATDEAGGSGIAEPSSGSIDLDTSSYGPATATAPAGTAKDLAGNGSAEVTCEYFVTENTPPVVDLVCPTSPLILGSSAVAEWTAYDPSPGSGIADDSPSSGSVALATSSVGSKTATVPAGTVWDAAGNESIADSCTYSVIYDFAGFFRPVDMGNVVNSAKAGSAVPIKFGLDGDQGLDILAAGSPTITFTSCNASATIDAIETTITAGGSSLSYDPVAGQYVYVWKTEKSWAGKCGTFALKLNDGTTHSALFKFLK